jgi:hypothetical protein
LPIDEDAGFLHRVQFKHRAVQQTTVKLSNILNRTLEEHLLDDLFIAELSNQPLGTCLAFVDIGLQEIDHIRHIHL